MILLEELKKLLTYDPGTGKFYWVEKRGGIEAGAEAGHGHGLGYIYIRINKVAYLAHRLAWFYVTGEWPKHQIDHVNKMRGDNRYENLRDATRSENCVNRVPRRGSKSGVTGVGWDNRSGKWMAYVERNKKRVNLGKFAGLPEAVQAREDYLKRQAE